MRLRDHVFCAFDDAAAGKLQAALLHACIAIDATSKRVFPSDKKVRRRFVATLRKCYWLLEPMVGAGFNLVETRFSNIHLIGNTTPDLAEIVYEVFRCSHAHGEEVPMEFTLITTEGGWISNWKMERDHLHMPDRIIWALLSVSVLSQANDREQGGGSCHLTLGEERFFVRDWWGREADFRAVAARYNTSRVKLDGLEGLERRTPGTPAEEKAFHLTIISPPTSE